MNPITYRFTLDLAKSGVQYVLSGIKTGDTNRVMEIHLTVNGTPYEIKPGTSARIRAVLPGNADVDGLCEIKGNMIRYEIPPSMLVTEGQVYADIEIGDEAGEKFATCEILMLIYKDLLGDEKPPETEFNSLIQAIAIAEGKAINNVTVTDEGALLIHLNDETEIDAGYVSPRLRINGATNEWEISYDGEETWENTGVRATGDVSEAVAEAEAAANLANDKAEKANDAAESASEAAAEARTAKDEALAAKDGANSAAEDAITIASYAAEAALKNASDAANTAYGAAADARRAASEIRNAKNNGEFNGEKGDPGIVDYSLVANALKGKKSGEAVALTDVSPLEHEMKVKVSQGGATVKKYGKNLFDASRLATARWSVDDSGVWSGTASTLRAFFPQTNPYMTFDNVDFITISLYGRSDNPNLSQSSMYINAIYEDGTKSTILRNFANTETYYKATSDTNKKIKGIFFDYGSFGDMHYMRDIQIEVGTTATEYEPYVAPTTHTAVGEAVEGIIGNGESMTLIPNTAGVTIEAEYNRDTNKVIANLMEKITALENAAAGLI